MSRPQCDGGGASGFTLIELIIALAIFGLVAASLSGGLRFGARAWETQDRLTASTGELDSVERVIRNLVVNAVSIEGAGDEATLVTRLPEGLAKPGLYDATLKTTVDGVLMLRWRRHNAKSPAATATEAATQSPGDQTDGGGAGQTHATQIATRLVRLRFAYFGAAAPASAAGEANAGGQSSETENAPAPAPANSAANSWRAQWRQADRLPKLVRITFVLPPDDARRWPDLVAGSPVEKPSG